MVKEVKQVKHDIESSMEASYHQQYVAPAPMMQNQKFLPRLPVPSLRSTMTKYFESVTPHLSQEELQRTKTAIELSLNSSDIHVLQDRLEAKAKSSDTVNWLSEWWVQEAYLKRRESVVINTSSYVVHTRDNTVNGIRRAAQIAKRGLEFHDLISR